MHVDRCICMRCRPSRHSSAVADSLPQRGPFGARNDRSKLFILLILVVHLLPDLHCFISFLLEFLTRFITLLWREGETEHTTDSAADHETSNYLAHAALFFIVRHVYLVIIIKVINSPDGVNPAIHDLDERREEAKEHPGHR